MSSVIAWLRIIRPPIVFISFLGALVGALNASAYLNNGPINLSLYQIIMIILGASALAAGLMIHNDVTDLLSDKVNRPHKPLPAGRITIQTARIAGVLLMVLSVFIALLITIDLKSSVSIIEQLNWTCGFFTLLIVIVGLYYNYYGKFHSLIGNITVAFGVGAIPFWGAIAIAHEHLLLMVPLAFAIFIQEIGREIMVNAGDYQGDLKAGFQTLPVQIGRKKAMWIALIFYLLFIPIYPIPYFGWFGADPVFSSSYFYIIGGTVFAISLLLTWVLTYLVVIKKDEEKIWSAFERYERTGTRAMVIFFQIMLLLEAFY
ncbi:MAG: UbiA family prenyltransferase [Candidatus Thermoplasmatota archaeon]|nr:UbiA family prenyltransferase [Candidatus Thermoplasmatota archaeon]MBU1941590.1 UbiA family prenyltransferase [Candidatus Thermoplasmatota archaeon]